MSVSSDVSEEIVKMYLEGSEVVLRIVGAGAKNVAVMLYALMKDNKRMKGKTRLTSLIKRGKNVKIYTIKGKDLKTFSKEAKRYGILYAVLSQTKFVNRAEFENKEIDILVSETDAPRIDRIAKKCHFVDVDRPAIQRDLEKELEEREKNKSKEKKTEELIDDILNVETQDNEVFIASPSKENTEEKNQSEISLDVEEYKKNEKMQENVKNKKSVRAELKEIKEELTKNQKQNNKEHIKNKKEKMYKENSSKNKFNRKKYKEK